MVFVTAVEGAKPILMPRFVAPRFVWAATLEMHPPARAERALFQLQMIVNFMRVAPQSAWTLVPTMAIATGKSPHTATRLQTSVLT